MGQLNAGLRDWLLQTMNLHIRGTYMEKIDILKIPGIGPKKKALFNSIGINESKDFLYYFPKKFKNYSKVTKICDLIDSKTGIVRIKVRKTISKRSKGGKRYLVVYGFDSTGELEMVFFNSHYIFKIIKEGNIHLFYGKALSKYNRIQMVNPEFVNPDEIGRILPVYKTVPGLSQNDFKKGVAFALNNSKGSAELLPMKIVRERNFETPLKTLENMHFPPDSAKYKTAFEKLIYVEFFLLQMTILKMKKIRLLESSVAAMKTFNLQEDKTVKMLPFKLTDSQSKIVRELSDLLKCKNCPKILLQGDVGTGKTLVAFLAARQSHLSGYQSAIMAPTELLAEQHYNTFKKLFGNSEMNVGILTANSQGKSKIKEKLKNGKCNLVVGTHAIIQDDVAFKNLGLIITDERHRFGVGQHDSLVKKGSSPQIIVMSATPIPRTISEIIFGDMEILRLTEKPNKSIKPVKTFLSKDQETRQAMHQHMRREMLLGRQVYYVCPRIENEDDSIASVEKTFKYFSGSLFHSFKISALHGRLSQNEKNDIMQAFRNREIDMIVSTTVIEVGIDVPNATIMAIDSFERFGLAQIHQLRGRVGRGAYESFCYLVTDKKDESTLEKAAILRNCSDGFEIAKEDMKIRGPGHVFSLKQHGFPEFKLADMFKHYKTLIKVQKDIETFYGHSLENLDISPQLERAIDLYAKQIKEINLMQGGTP